MQIPGIFQMSLSDIESQQNFQRHRASRDLSAIAEFLVNKNVRMLHNHSLSVLRSKPSYLFLPHFPML